MTDVGTHDAEELEVWSVTIPKAGITAHGHGIQGTITERFHLSRAEGDRLETSLKRYNVAAARRGRPRYWRGEREVIGRLPDGEERQEVTAIAEELPSAAINTDATTRSLEGYRTALEREIAELQSRKASLWADLAAQEAQTAERHQQLLRNQADHLVAQTERLRTAEERLYQGFIGELERYKKGREALGELQPRDAWAEALREARGLVEAAASSSVGQLGALFASTALAEKMVDKFGADKAKVTPARLLDAAMFQGEAFRGRVRGLKELCGLTSAHPETRAAMLCAVDFLCGDLAIDLVQAQLGLRR